MPRHRRVVIPGCPHHVMQRGNNRRDVFYSDLDRKVYLALLKEYCVQYDIEVLGYCLLTNHIHALVIPATSNGLAKAFGKTHSDYARWLHVRRRECGHLWQNRFYSCPIENQYLWAVLAYIERNPVRAGIVARCEEWPWSSALTHVQQSEGTEWLELRSWAETWTPAQWQFALASSLNEAELRARLEEATCAGRPLGGTAFVEDCEQRSGLRLRPQKPGPKAKAQAPMQQHADRHCA